MKRELIGKMAEISDSMSDAWASNEDYFMKNMECSFEITEEQKDVIEYSIDMFKEWFDDRYDDLVFEGIEFEPFFNGMNDAFIATIKFSRYED